MDNLKFGDKIIVLHESSIERGTLEETMLDGVEAYWVRYSADGRDVIRKENVFSDTDDGKRDLIDVAVKRLVSLNKIVGSLFGELKK
jgi:hypothetical protein